MNIRLAGIPIKDRGIHWAEAYNDKSAYLKEEYEKQVGPGSYFRWEGHDHVTGEDYYVVVTPGFSKKKGYHFFAALRKIPAENGASGKKFKTQAEALSHAMDTWRVPRPKTPPHKSYTTDDLTNKPIVLENVHSSTSPRIVIVSNRERGQSMIVIDASENTPAALTKEASLMHSARHGTFFKRPGPRSLASRLKTGALAQCVMGKGAANYIEHDFNLIDTLNQSEQDRVVDRGTGQSTSEIVPHMATCENPDPEAFEQAVHTHGVKRKQRLFTPKMQLIPPAYPDAENSRNYKITRLGELTNLSPKCHVGWKKLAKFEEIITGLRGTPEPVVDANGNPVAGPDGQAQQGVRIGSNEDGSPKYATDNQGRFVIPLRSRYFTDPSGNPRRVSSQATQTAQGRKDSVYSFDVPLDNFEEFKAAMEGVAKVDRLQPSFQAAASMWKHMEEQGLVESERERVLATPMFEEQVATGGSLVVFDKESMLPLGVRITGSSEGMDMESFSGGGAKRDYQYVFAQGAISRMLADPATQAETGATPLEKLRNALVHNRIHLTHDMFVDCATAAPLLHPVRSVMPHVDENLVPQTDPQGGMVMERRNIVPDYTVQSPNNRVRVYNNQTHQYEVVPMPDGVQANQSFNGLPAISKGTPQKKVVVTYVPIARRGPDGQTTQELHEISAGEWKHYDPNSRGKFVPGNAYTLVIKRQESSAKKSDTKNVYGLETERNGFYVGYKETYAWRRFRRGMPTRKHLGARDENAQPPYRFPVVTDIMLNDGTLVPYPSDGDVNSEGYRALSNARNVYGYYYVCQRQHNPKPLKSERPVGSQAVEIQQYHRRPDGTIGIATDASGQPLPPLRITENDVIVGSDDNLYLTSTGVAIKMLKAMFGLGDFEIGRWTNVTSQDLRIIDDKVKAARQKIAAVENGEIGHDQLDEWENLLAAIPEKGDKIAPQIIQSLSGISPNNPQDFAPKNAPLYGISNYDDNVTFGTEQQAQAFLEQLNQNPNHAEGMQVIIVNQQPDGSYGSVLPSVHFAQARGEQPTLSHNTELQEVASLYGDDEAEQVAAGDEGTDEGEEGTEEVATDIPAEAPTAEQPAAPNIVSTPDSAPAQVADDEIVPIQPDENDVVPIADTGPAQVPAPVAPTGPVVPRKPNDREAAAINRLIRLADKLDLEGRHKEADAVDRLIQSTLSTKRK
jgi:hypothetical protein